MGLGRSHPAGWSCRCAPAPSKCVFSAPQCPRNAPFSRPPPPSLGVPGPSEPPKDQWLYTEMTWTRGLPSAFPRFCQQPGDGDTHLAASVMSLCEMRTEARLVAVPNLPVLGAWLRGLA